MGFWYTLNFRKIPLMLLFFSAIKCSTFTINTRIRNFVQLKFPLKILKYLQFYSLSFGKVYGRHPQHPLSRTFIISNFFFGSFSTLGNCSYKFVRYLEPRYVELSLCRTIFSLSFHFTHSNVESKNSKTLIEYLSFLISTQQHVGKAKA